jgi:hypothetical protein
MDPAIVEALRKRYKVHPLLFQRSVEKSKSPGDLFDILDGLPDGFPLVWSESDHRWVITEHISQNL